MFDGKSVFVSGGTGSFGRAFIRTLLARYQPKRVVVFSRDELKQYEMQQEFNAPACAISWVTCATPTACSRPCAASTWWSTPPR